MVARRGRRSFPRADSTPARRRVAFARARRPAFRRGAREAPSETPASAASATRGARKIARARVSVDSGLDLLGARQTVRPAGRLEGYAQLMPLVLRTLAKLRCVDATRVSGHPSRQHFSATASLRCYASARLTGTKKSGVDAAARPGGSTLPDHPTFRLARRALAWTPALGSRDPGAWFRAHAHPLARDGPPRPAGRGLGQSRSAAARAGSRAHPDSVRGLGVHVWPIGRGGRRDRVRGGARARVHPRARDRLRQRARASVLDRRRQARRRRAGASRARPSPVPFRNLPPRNSSTRRLPSERFSRFSWAPSLSIPRRRARSRRRAERAPRAARLRSTDVRLARDPNRRVLASVFPRRRRSIAAPPRVCPTGRSHPRTTSSAGCRRTTGRPPRCRPRRSSRTRRRWRRPPSSSSATTRLPG